MKKLIVWVLLASWTMLTGCPTRINVIEQSVGAERFTPAPKTANYSKPVLFVKQVALKSDGIPAPIGDQFLRQVHYKFQESELFGDVTFRKPWGKPVTLSLSVEEVRDDHAVTNFVKGLFVGVTLFLLAPVLPKYEEYRMDVSAEITLPQGQTKLYRAGTSAEVYYNEFQTAQAKREHYMMVLNRTFNSLLSQMLTDQPLLALENVEPRTLHLSSRVRYGIWTDNTKWVRTDSAPPREMMFKHAKGDAFAMVVAERIEIPLETMKKAIVKNAESGIADLVVTESDKRTVNGREILYIRMHGTEDGVPIEYMVYVISGRIGTIQIFTYTGANLISEYEKDFLEFLNGFVIEPT